MAVNKEIWIEFDLLRDKQGKEQKEAWKARKRKTELKEQKQSYSTNPECSRLGVAEPPSPFSLIHHPMPRHDARRLGVDEAARKMTLYQGLNA
ncbi:hypothetical protein PIB30_071816 [Stylosanthes scabra]|uniref:Uncharacterized protein n=1 Tax=Stylosanthes scabra TaxID=79078 RepID=A0ABU6UQL1_9FABA|nr:hypothetical protein [Stylosanthes scabra]